MPKSPWLVFLIIFSQGLTAAFAQTPKRAISLSGDLRAELKYDGIRGRQQGRPRWIRTFAFTPRVELPHFPAIDFLMKLSTLEETIRQPFNRLNIHVTRNWGEFYLGDSYPVFSKYTLNGILVRGGSFDINPGIFRLAVAAGQSKRAISESYQSQTPTFKQQFYGIKLGVGKKKGSQLNLNLIKVRDEAGSLKYVGTNRPQDNAVIGLDGSLQLYKKKISLSGEIAGSAFTRDAKSPKVKVPQQVPGIATRIFKPRISSQYDLAYFFNPKFSLSTTTLRGNFRHVGAGFFSLGTPYLHNDIQGYGLAGTQRLWKNKIYLTAGLDRSRDNLDGLKSATTATSSGYANTNVTPKKLPAINLGYRFYTQRNNDSNARLRVNNKMQSISLGASYRVRLFDLNHSLRATFSKSWYRNRSPNARSTSDYDNQIVRIAASTRLKLPVTISASLGFSRNQLKRVTKRDSRWLYNLSVTHRAFKQRLISRLRLNVDEGRLKKQSLYSTRNDSSYVFQYSKRRRMNLSLQSDYRSKSQTFSFRLSRIVYSDWSFPENNYRELVVELIFTRHFGMQVPL